jgi:hypothetical protein
MVEGSGRGIQARRGAGFGRRARSSEVWRPAPAHVRWRRVAVGEEGVRGGEGSGTGKKQRRVGRLVEGEVGRARSTKLQKFQIKYVFEWNKLSNKFFIGIFQYSV